MKKLGEEISMILRGNAFLDFQREKYEQRAALAVVDKNRIVNEAVVGSYAMQEAFPYDENILKYFDGPYDEVLEYGCGPGRNLLRLSSKFKLVAGTDISQKNIDNARKLLELNNVSNFDLFVTPGDTIPVRSGYYPYNLIFEVICFQHICSYSIRRNILRHMTRCCLSGGMIVLQMGFNDKTLPRSNHNTRYYTYYYEEPLDNIPDTNGASDCCVTDPEQPVKDLKDLGMTDIKVWYTEGVNDINHDKWIWVSGRKP